MLIKATTVLHPALRPHLQHKFILYNLSSLLLTLLAYRNCPPFIYRQSDSRVCITPFLETLPCLRFLVIPLRARYRKRVSPIPYPRTSLDHPITHAPQPLLTYLLTPHTIPNRTFSIPKDGTTKRPLLSTYTLHRLPLHYPMDQAVPLFCGLT
jgi:hypothetical protein